MKIEGGGQKKGYSRQKGEYFQRFEARKYENWQQYRLAEMLREIEEEEWGWWETDCLIRAMICKRRLENINIRVLTMMI